MSYSQLLSIWRFYASTSDMVHQTSPYTVFIYQGLYTVCWLPFMISIRIFFFLLIIKISAVSMVIYQLLNVNMICRSASIFVFVYSLFFFYNRSSMSGILQTVEFFGYTILTCYIFFLSLGTVGFFSALKFVRYIYVNVKMD